MIVTSMQLTISSRRDIAVLRKKSSPREGEEDVKTVEILSRLIEDGEQHQPNQISVQVFLDFPAIIVID